MPTTVNDGLPPCAFCGDVDRLVAVTPGQWLRQVEAVRALIANGVLQQLEGSDPLDEVTAEDPFLGEDVVTFLFGCRHCDRLFVLTADLHHGNASWGPPLGPPMHAPDAPWEIEQPDQPQARDRRRWRRGRRG